MALADELAIERAALEMINPAPYNAEAPAVGLVGKITPTRQHYVRSNFPLPEHDGTLAGRRCGGQPDDPHRRGPARPAGTGRGRHAGVCGQRTPGHEATPDR